MALLAVGTMVQTALRVAESLIEDGVEATVLNCRFIKPLDEALLTRTILRHDRLITLEEAALPGGFGERVARFLTDHPQVSSHVALKCLGIPDVFIQHASRKEQLDEAGLSPDAVRRLTLAFLASSVVESFGSGRASGA